MWALRKVSFKGTGHTPLLFPFLFPVAWNGWCSGSLLEPQWSEKDGAVMKVSLINMKPPQSLWIASGHFFYENNIHFYLVYFSFFLF